MTIKNFSKLIKKKMWQFVYTKLNSKTNERQIKVNNTSIKDDPIKANLFNTYFSTRVTKLVKKYTFFSKTI